jgi:hypothetical protein
MEQLTPQQMAENDLRAARDSVSLINELIAKNEHSEDIDNTVRRNYQHLEIVMQREHIVADTSDKSDLTNAITAGKAFAPEV